MQRFGIFTIQKLKKPIFSKTTNYGHFGRKGFSWEEVKQMKLMEYLDVLVDGEFVVAKKDVNLHWVGSSNQRVIDVQQSLAKGTVVFHEDDCE